MYILDTVDRDLPHCIWGSVTIQYLQDYRWNKIVPLYNILSRSTSPLLTTCGTHLGGSRLQHSAYRYLCPRNKRIKQ